MNKRSADHATEKPAADAETMFSLLHAGRVVEERLEAALADAELSFPKFTVLSFLAEANEPLTLSEIAGRMKCVRSNITQLVDRLEADGLVKRVDHPNDRRVVHAALTPLGRERQARGAERVEAMQREFAAVLTDGDAAVMRRIFQAIG
jgi:DNA-binding MarR family transcriptional regulator